MQKEEEEEEYCGSNSSINWWNIHPLIDCYGYLMGA